MTTTDVLLSGALAAFSIDLLIYPLDTIKTRLQAVSPSSSSSSSSSSSATSSLRRIHFRSLYHGVGPVIIATLPASATFFAVYETLHKTLPHGPLTTPFASAIAELASCAILTPAEVVKQNAQVLQSPGSSDGGGGSVSPTTSASLRAFKKIGSYRALWTGYTTLAARNLPFTALQFTMFEPAKRRLGISGGEERVSGKGLLETVWLAGVAAGGSGAVAAAATTPVDVVKTRIMLNAGNGGGGSGVTEVAREIWGKEGLKGFWRGGVVRMVWTAVGGGLYLGIFEGGKVGFGMGRRLVKGEEGEGEKV